MPIEPAHLSARGPGASSYRGSRVSKYSSGISKYSYGPSSTDLEAEAVRQRYRSLSPATSLGVRSSATSPAPTRRLTLPENVGRSSYTRGFTSLPTSHAKRYSFGSYTQPYSSNTQPYAAIPVSARYGECLSQPRQTGSNFFEQYDSSAPRVTSFTPRYVTPDYSTTLNLGDVNLIGQNSRESPYLPVAGVRLADLSTVGRVDIVVPDSVVAHLRKDNAPPPSPPTHNASAFHTPPRRSGEILSRIPLTPQTVGYSPEKAEENEFKSLPAYDTKPSIARECSSDTLEILFKGREGPGEPVEDLEYEPGEPEEAQTPESTQQEAISGNLVVADSAEDGPMEEDGILGVLSRLTRRVRIAAGEISVSERLEGKQDDSKDHGMKDVVGALKDSVERLIELYIDSYPVGEGKPPIREKEVTVEKTVTQHVTVEVPVEKLVQIPVDVERVVEVVKEIPVTIERVVEVPITHTVEKRVEVQVPAREVVVEKPVEIHTPKEIVEKFVDRVVEIPTTVERVVEVERTIEVPVTVEKIVDRIVDKHIDTPRTVERVIEKIVTKEVKVPYTLTVEKIKEIPVPRIVEVLVTITKEVEKKVTVPIEVTKTVLVEKFIDGYEDNAHPVSRRDETFSVTKHDITASRASLNRPEHKVVSFVEGENSRLNGHYSRSSRSSSTTEKRVYVSSVDGFSPRRTQGMHGRNHTTDRIYRHTEYISLCSEPAGPTRVVSDRRKCGEPVTRNVWADKATDDSYPEIHGNDSMEEDVYDDTEDHTEDHIHEDIHGDYDHTQGSSGSFHLEDSESPRPRSTIPKRSQPSDEIANDSIPGIAIINASMHSVISERSLSLTSESDWENPMIDSPALHDSDLEHSSYGHLPR